MDLNKRRVIEHQKARCREKIDFHKKNVILQCIISSLCLMGGVYAGQKRSIAVPLVLAPMVSASCSTLVKHETKRKYYRRVLDSLEKE